MIRKNVSLMLLALLLAATPALADPINITSGTIFYQRQDLASISASAAGGWSLQTYFGMDESWWPSDMGPTTPGSQVNLSQSESITNQRDAPFAGGSFKADGTEYWIDSLAFTIRALGTVTAPATDNIPNDGVVTFSDDWARFVFEGTVAGTSDAGISAQAMLTGAGRARLATLDNNWFASDYRFDDPAPVPEPGTLLLFATGAAVAIRRRFSRTSAA